MSINKLIIDKERCCLIIIDIQERLFNSMDFDVRRNVVKNTGILIETAKVFNIPIILTEQYRKGLGPTIRDVREKIPDVESIDKTYFNCMKDPAISSKLSELGRSSVILTGIETHICILFTALTLLESGYDVFIASDAVCSRRRHEWEIAINSLSYAGAFIYPTETISFMIMEKSGTEEFKRLSPLFKMM
jgi:nicotinamidase-related amidase